MPLLSALDSRGPQPPPAHTDIRLWPQGSCRSSRSCLTKHRQQTPPWRPQSCLASSACCSPLQVPVLRGISLRSLGEGSCALASPDTADLACDPATRLGQRTCTRGMRPISSASQGLGRGACCQAVLPAVWGLLSATGLPLSASAARRGASIERCLTRSDLALQQALVLRPLQLKQWELALLSTLHSAAMLLTARLPGSSSSSIF